MSRRRIERPGNTAIKELTREVTRAGLCLNCHIDGVFHETLRAVINPLKRKPDGTMYTEQEAGTALEDFALRWEKGPFLHRKCSAEYTDKLAGFDINTGTYGTPPANVYEIMTAGTQGSGGGIIEPGPLWNDPDVQIEISSAA
jgi:hypothetical protein